MFSRIIVRCRTHGDFEIVAHNFLGGQGCRKCKSELLKKVIHGVGINDLLSESHTQAYIIWHQMIQRCYSQKFQKARPLYKECSVCDEWLVFSRFKEWFDKNYQKGYCLDKDILSGKLNKTYSPDTCCFIPYRINSLIVRNNARRGDLPIGISKIKGTSRYEVHLSKNGNTSHRIGCFRTIAEAFSAYKTAKEAYIKEVAQEYYDRGEITKRIYAALMRYEVEITD